MCHLENNSIVVLLVLSNLCAMFLWSLRLLGRRTEYFCLRRSPDHGTVEVVLVIIIVVVQTIFMFIFFPEIWKIL